jgi:hypothetical protein
MTTTTPEVKAEALHHLFLVRSAAIELRPGERYAGLLLDADGQINHHLVLLPGEAEKINFADACTWAAKAGGELPSRREQALLFANLPGEFQPRWYWSGESYENDGSGAWIQPFDNGLQDHDHKAYEGRARAVRRVTA